MTFARRTIYIPAEYADDIRWMEQEFKDQGFSKTLLTFLRIARLQRQNAQVCADNRGMPDAAEGYDYYTRKFGYLAADYENDRDVLETLGSNGVYNMLDAAFKKIRLENPAVYSFCVEQMKREHPALYQIWE
ncbi:MAG TPA: hypothetical protein O0X70_04470 [Methanocorpusculum sp.]|nr:hypothetical protein [Methanocorpusculum sp.]